MKVILSSAQADFIKKEFGYGFPANKEFDIPQKKKHEIFERCTEIETDESRTDDDMSPDGMIAVSLVTLIGGH